MTFYSCEGNCLCFFDNTLRSFNSFHSNNLSGNNIFVSIHEKAVIDIIIISDLSLCKRRKSCVLLFFAVDENIKYIKNEFFIKAHQHIAMVVRWVWFKIFHSHCCIILMLLLLLLCVCVLAENIIFFVAFLLHDIFKIIFSLYCCYENGK